MVFHRIVLSLLLAGPALLTACDNTGSVGAFGTPRGHGATASTMEFRGQRPCVDCIAIEAWLRLEQSGNERRYTLLEVYRAEAGERRFEESGRWESSGDLLRLHLEGGGQRVYAVLPDNRLQAVDGRGGLLPALGDEILVPTTYSNER